MPLLLIKSLLKYLAISSGECASVCYTLPYQSGAENWGCKLPPHYTHTSSPHITAHALLRVAGQFPEVGEERPVYSSSPNGPISQHILPWGAVRTAKTDREVWRPFLRMLEE
jgi:hypothetical protein